MRVLVYALAVRVVAHATICPINNSRLACPTNRITLSNGTCAMCEQGRYINVQTRTCMPCPAGKFKLALDQQCSPCQVGLYQDEEGQPECKVCADGQVSRYPGATACQACPDGTHYRGDGVPHSVMYGIACESYTPLSVYPTIKPLSYVMDISNVSAFMAKCDSSTLISDPQSVLVSYCTFKEHPKPQYCLERIDDPLNPDHGLCTSCTLNDRKYPPKCISCPHGSGVVNKTCEMCPAGKKNDGSDVCLNCSRGHFASSRNSTECLKCPSARYTIHVGSAECTACPDNWKDNPNYIAQDSFDACTMCPNGRYSHAGDAECTLCPEGKVWNTGTHNNGTHNTFLEQSAETVCEACPAGRHETLATPFIHPRTSCSNCAAGFYQDAEGQPLCKVCPGGTYTNNVEATVCKNCTTGQYQEFNNSQGCNECPVGQYSGTTAAITCQPCKPGQFANETGHNVCWPSSPGRYVPGHFANESLQCPVGEITPFFNSSECISCGSATSNANRTACVTCTCDNGVPKTGLACQGHASDLHQCHACNTGFFLNGTKCDVVRAPANGNGQIVDGIAYICNAGYVGDNVAKGVAEYLPCVEKLCTCELDASLAAPATGINCLIDGTRNCSCAGGRSGHYCEHLYSCTCSNGTPKNSTECVSSEDMNQCRDCNAGFYLNGTKCDAARAPANGNGQIVDGIAYVCDAGYVGCLLYTSPSPRDYAASRMPSSA